MSAVIVTDLDDTLWPCHGRYVSTARRFAEIASESLGCGPDEASEEFLRAEGRWRKAGCRGGGRWVDSMLFAYGRLCGMRGRLEDPGALCAIQALDAELWAAPEPFPGVPEALEGLRRGGVPVYCFTAGGEVQQGRKISELRRLRGLDLHAETSGVTIVPRKDEDEHARFAHGVRARHPGARLAYVGDSVVNDMLPARAAGYDGLWQIATDRQWPPLDGMAYTRTWRTVPDFAAAVGEILGGAEWLAR